MGDPTHKPLSTGWLEQVEAIRRVMPLPAVERLYFPQPAADDDYRDEFGFVFLDSGDVGPFYVSLGDTLQQLWKRFPNPEAVKLPLDDLLAGLASADPAARALGLGAFNALSQAVMRLSGYTPWLREKRRDTKRSEIERVGMVGYFCPLVDRLTEHGIRVTVLEMVPERVPDRPLVTVTTDPGDLSGCDRVFCTASTLINDSLDSILETCRAVPEFALIGPTASGLPDRLFERGVDEVGGIHFGDAGKLLKLLDGQESWGSAGQKYSLRQEAWPGLEALLRTIAAGRS